MKYKYLKQGKETEAKNIKWFTKYIDKITYIGRVIIQICFVFYLLLV